MNHGRKARTELLVIAPRKKIAEDERGQGGQLPDESDPDATDKKDENNGEDAEIN